MAPAFSKFLSSRLSAAVVTGAFLVHTLNRNRRRKQIRRVESVADLPAHIDETPLVKKSQKDRAAVDIVFFKRLVRVLRVLIPGWFSAETGYLALVALALMARTYCDVWMIQNGTAIESSIIGRDITLFKKYLFNFIYAMPAISLINNLLKYGLNEVKLRFRTRLTTHLYEQYLKGFTYYKMSNLDNRIANADQLLTQDVERFCNSVADLYSNLSKPVLDILIYIRELAASIGPQGPAYMIAYLLVSGMVLTRLRRPVGKMTVEEQRYEGEFRYVNSRLITNSEEVAFYQGNKRERRNIYHAFNKLVNHLRSFIFFRFSMGFVDNIIAKYFATVVGYLVVSRPFLDLSHAPFKGKSHSFIMQTYYQAGYMILRMSQAIGRIVLAGREMTRLAGDPLPFKASIASYIATTVQAKCCFSNITNLWDGSVLEVQHSSQTLDDITPFTLFDNQEYYQAGRMLLRMAEAVGRIVLAGREMTRLAGFTQRVTELMTVLKELNMGRYERTMVREAKDSDSEDDREPLVPGSGKLILQDHVIEFKQVPLVTPNGDILVREMSFEVKSGMNVLVCGPNGCGKSSLFRILGELWPLFGGTLIKPDAKKLFYVPQRPYMTLGTLRDQIIYPDCKEDMLRKGISDKDLEQSMAQVQLSNILEREGGWDAVQDWMDVLSGGEKQRVAMARLFYHKPQFAILDECTSAVSVDVEGFIYSHAREVGITLFTVSHRKSLWKHHEYYLMFDGRGAYEYKPIDKETIEFGS